MPGSPRLRTQIGRALPFADSSFEVVVLAGFVFNHLPAPRRAAAECARVLSRGGRCALAIWDEPRPSSFFAVLAEAMERAGIDITAHIPAGPNPYLLARHGELERLTLDAGLIDVRVSSIEASVRTSTIEELLDGIRGGTVRAAAALEAASAEERLRVGAELRSTVAACQVDGAVHLRASVKLAAAIKP
jgi:SAM-dependent methyltransferase